MDHNSHSSLHILRDQTWCWAER